MAINYYPDNSNNAQKEEKKEVQKVVTGEVVKQKKSSGRKFLETFFVEDLKSIKSYVIEDVVIPYAKNILSDAFNAMLYGSNGRSNRTPVSRLNQTTSYQRYYEQPKKTPTVNSSEGYDVDNMIFRNYTDADKVLDGLRDICREYDMASVGDLKMLLGDSTTPSDYNWGWDNLDGASIARTKDGYMIRMPRTVRIK